MADPKESDKTPAESVMDGDPPQEKTADETADELKEAEQASTEE